MTYRLRMIFQGRVVQQSLIEAATPAEAWALAHPAKADPLLRARQGVAAAWVEVAPADIGERAG